MRKDGIQTRKRKPKPGKETASHSSSKHKVHDARPIACNLQIESNRQNLAGQNLIGS